MTSLGNDAHWLDAKNFLKTHLQPTERIIAPAKYKRELPNASGYDTTHDPAAEQFEWVLVHKGLTAQIEGAFLRRTIVAWQPVFANEVFVVFAKHAAIQPDFNQLKPHLQPLLQKVDPEQAAQMNKLHRPGWIDRLTRPLKRAAKTPKQVNEISTQINLMQSQLNQLDRQMKKLQREKTLTLSADKLAKLSMAELRAASRAACQTAYLGNGTILCRVLTHYLLYGDAQDVEIVPHLCLNGYWEPRNTLAMARLLQPGDYCIDVGANAGYFSLLMASAVGESGRVVAIEPNLKLVDLLRKTLKVNGFESRATVLPRAVSNVSGETVRLVVPQGFAGVGTIMREMTENDTVYPTETITIDEITADWARVDLIKIDAEGAEEQIWQGMRQTVRRHPNLKIVLEFGASRYADPKAFLQDIRAEGFVLHFVDDRIELKELPIDRCLTERPDSHWDLFLIRKATVP